MGDLEWNNIFQAVFGNGLVSGILGIVTFIIIIAILRSIIKVTLTDKIIVVNGRKKSIGSREFGFSVERCRTTVVPYIQESQYLDLSVYPIYVRVEGVNSANGITVGADATACVCIDDDNEPMLYKATEKLMGKTTKEVQDQIQQTLIGNFRGALNKATPLQAIGMDDTHIDDNQGKKADEGDRALFRSELLKDINSDLSNFGMKVVSVSFQKIWDTSNYIANLAQKTLARKRQEVEIEEARLRANAEQIESDGKRRINVAVNQANEKIIQAKQKLEMYRRESAAQIQKINLEADSSIQEALNRGQKDIQEKKVELQKIQNSSKVILESEALYKQAQIFAEGKSEAIRIKEDAKNSILKQKIELFEKAGEIGKIVFFLQQVPQLFSAFKNYTKDIHVKSLVIMDSEKGFNGAVNRGAEAFVDFLKYVNEGIGLNIKDLLTNNTEVKTGKGDAK